MATWPSPEIAVSWVKARPSLLNAGMAEAAATIVEVPPTS